MVDPPASAEAAKTDIVVFLLNEGQEAQAALGPAELDVVARDGTHLRLVAKASDGAMVAPGGFARVRYQVASAGVAPSVAVAAPPVVAKSSTEQTGQTSAGTSNGFLDRFHSYAPTYAAFGAGDASLKLQLSFDFRLFGRDEGPHLDFAYTQTIFWALDRPSGPIRATTYSPELFVDVPVSKNLVIGGGYRHDSNGGGLTNSVDANRLFVRATRTFDLGHDWRFDVTPMAWLYFGERGSVSDLDRYWGYTSLGVSLGQRNGIKLAVTARGNPGTGKGSAEAFLSYPLVRISDALPHLYLFGQAYTGYGEALIDYNKRGTRVRAGIAFTR